MAGINCMYITGFRLLRHDDSPVLDTTCTRFKEELL